MREVRDLQPDFPRSCCVGEGRSAKAINRTEDMRVLEESDCAVVPVNHPNEAVQPRSNERRTGEALSVDPEHLILVALR
jgi:hypothetical protein